jgi:response regulator of citrate/malate metabolism
MNFLKKLFKIKSPKSGIIFIVEDNPIYAKTLEAFVRSCFPDTKEIIICPTGEICLSEFHKNPDVIIVDYFLDTNNQNAATGIDIIKKIRVEKSETNIIVLSSQKEIEVVLEAVKTYQCSYIKKDEQAFGRLEEILKEIY